MRILDSIFAKLDERERKALGDLVESVRLAKAAITLGAGARLGDHRFAADKARRLLNGATAELERDA